MIGWIDRQIDRQVDRQIDRQIGRGGQIQRESRKRSYKKFKRKSSTELKCLTTRYPKYL